MKKILLAILISLLLIITTINIVFLIETTKDKPLREFFYSSKELPEVYSEKEKTHMQGVKNLAINSLLINLILLIPSVYLLKKKKINLKLSGCIGLIITSILLIFSLFFQTFFNYFHLIFFNSTNYILPSNSRLIQDYPLIYFRNIFLIILGILTIENTILINLKKIKNINQLKNKR